MLYFALKPCLKGYWGTGDLLWHPFDDSRVLNDPNAPERGLWRLSRLPHSIFCSQNQTLYPLFCLATVFYRVLRYGGTYCSIHLIIQGF